MNEQLVGGWQHRVSPGVVPVIIPDEVFYTGSLDKLRGAFMAAQEPDDDDDENTPLVVDIDEDAG